MPALAILLLALQASPTSAAGNRAVLDSFRAACSRADNAAQMRADALRSGWTEIREDADPRIARIVREGRATLPGGARATAVIFRRVSAAPNMFLVQSRLESEGSRRSFCRIYHFGARAIDPALLERWMGRRHTRAENAGPSSRLLWEPGWRAGLTVEVSHISEPEAERAGVNGNMLVARAAGDH